MGTLPRHLLSGIRTRSGNALEAFQKINDPWHGSNDVGTAAQVFQLPITM